SYRHGLDWTPEMRAYWQWLTAPVPEDAFEFKLDDYMAAYQAGGAEAADRYIRSLNSNGAYGDIRGWIAMELGIDPAQLTQGDLHKSIIYQNLPDIMKFGVLDPMAY